MTLAQTEQHEADRRDFDQWREERAGRRARFYAPLSQEQQIESQRLNSLACEEQEQAFHSGQVAADLIRSRDFWRWRINPENTLALPLSPELKAIYRTAADNIGPQIAGAVQEQRKHLLAAERFEKLIWENEREN